MQQINNSLHTEQNTSQEFTKRRSDDDDDRSGNVMADFGDCIHPDATAHRQCIVSVRVGTLMMS